MVIVVMSLSPVAAVVSGIYREPDSLPMGSPADDA
jgi:hypothetical protein